MRGIMLEIGPDGELEGSMILADCQENELIAGRALDRILENKDRAPAVHEEGDKVPRGWGLWRKSK